MIQRLPPAVEGGTGRADAVRKIIYGGGPIYLEEIKALFARVWPGLCANLRAWRKSDNNQRAAFLRLWQCTRRHARIGGLAAQRRSGQGG